MHIKINFKLLNAYDKSGLEDSGLESDQDSFGDKSSFMRKTSHGSTGEQRSPGLSFNSRSFSILHRRYVTNEKQ